jgi:hypothetical protein
MLKKSASVVLASFRPSTYPRGYASVLHSLRPCWRNFLNILQSGFLFVGAVLFGDIQMYRHGFSIAH